MTSQDLLDKLIKDGKASILKHETEQETIEGGLLGFDLVAKLGTDMRAYEKELEKRQMEELRQMSEIYDTFEDSLKEHRSLQYRKYRATTMQIQYVYEILKVMYKYPKVSARAVMKYAEIVGVKE